MMKGTVRLLFQPAEEGGAGASHMVKEGVLHGVEAIFAMHVDHRIPTGIIAAHAGPTQAAVCFYIVRIEGKSGRAETPHLNADPIAAAAFTILSLQQLTSREDDPLHSQVRHCPLAILFCIADFLQTFYTENYKENTMDHANKQKNFIAKKSRVNLAHIHVIGAICVGVPLCKYPPLLLKALYQLKETSAKFSPLYKFSYSPMWSAPPLCNIRAYTSEDCICSSVD
jgi:acetylornithine deacetylase/succinyl-diaminopimelate desuccinylase-like protein